MADNQQQFEGFLKNIQLIGDGLTSLRTSRDANRKRIKDHWRDTLKRSQPDFEEQGSFEMGTVVKPIEGDYDLDDGMYLNCIGDDSAKWPATSTVQGWIADAVNGATREDPKKMKRCVRVPYQGGYHIDIPAYGKDSFGTVRVFKKDTEPSDFEESNPVALVTWFGERKKSHADLRDLVRFFKAWRDHKKGALTKIKSVTMTILISEKIVSADTFAEAVIATARACDFHIRYSGKISKPVSPFEDLTSSWSDDDRTKIADAFKTLADRGDDAFAAETVREGALIWEKQFGSRFPVPDEETSKAFSVALITKEPPVVASGTFA